MKKRSVKWNVVLNVIRMSLSVFFPLITFPYASRTLGAESLGTVNYTLTFVNYAALIAALGISPYAAREGARVREDKARIGQFTRQIFTLNLLTTLLAYVILFITVSLLGGLHPYWKLILIQSLSILFTTLSVEWLNVIYEDYLYTTIRGVATNLLTVVLLFLLVKRPEDYYLYAGLTVVSHAVVSIANYFHCRRYVAIGLTGKIDLKRHLRPILIFFASSLAVSIYVNSDSTMLGWMVGNVNVGLYSAAVKVYSMVKTVLAAMYGVTISRMAFYLSSNDQEAYRSLCRKVVNGINTVLLPGAFALFLFSKDIILILSGKEYETAGTALQTLSVGLVFAIIGGFIVTCVNIPNGREKINMYAAFGSAMINIVLNIFIIPSFQQNGAALTTVIAELVVCAVCFVRSFDLLRGILRRDMLRPVIDGCVGIGIIAVSSFLTRGLLERPGLHFVVNLLIALGGYGLYLILSGNQLAASYLKSFRR